MKSRSVCFVTLAAMSAVLLSTAKPSEAATIPVCNRTRAGQVRGDLACVKLGGWVWRQLVADTTAAPVTAAPVTAAPVTAAPVTAAPVTAAPVTAAPAVIANLPDPCALMNKQLFTSKPPVVSSLADSPLVRTCQLEVDFGKGSSFIGYFTLAKTSNPRDAAKGAKDDLPDTDFVAVGNNVFQQHASQDWRFYTVRKGVRVFLYVNDYWRKLTPENIEVFIALVVDAANKL
jgi:hypothetical protein